MRSNTLSPFCLALDVPFVFPFDFGYLPAAPRGGCEGPGHLLHEEGRVEAGAPMQCRYVPSNAKGDDCRHSTPLVDSLLIGSDGGIFCACLGSCLPRQSRFLLVPGLCSFGLRSFPFVLCFRFVLTPSMLVLLGLLRTVFVLVLGSCSPANPGFFMSWVCARSDWWKSCSR